MSERQLDVAPKAPYPTFGDGWRKRWVQIGKASTLHRVASTVPPTEEQWAETEREWQSLGLDTSKQERDDWDADGLIPRGIHGTTACGLSGRLGMPGIFSRMGAPRCKMCCRKVGILAGNGAPFNDVLPEEQRNA